MQKAKSDLYAKIKNWPGLTKSKNLLYKSKNDLYAKMSKWPLCKNQKVVLYEKTGLLFSASIHVVNEPNKTKIKHEKISINPCCIWLTRNQNYRKLKELQSIPRCIKISVPIHAVVEPNRTTIKHETNQHQSMSYSTLTESKAPKTKAASRKKWSVS